MYRGERNEVLSCRRQRRLPARLSYNTLMKTVTVTWSKPKDSVSCVAFLDEGSAVTLVTTEIARRIGCSGKQQKLRIQTINGIFEHTAEKVSFEVQESSFPQEEPKKHKLQDVYAVSTLPLGPHMVSEEQIFERYPGCKQYTHCLLLWEESHKS